MLQTLFSAIRIKNMRGRDLALHGNRENLSRQIQNYDWEFFLTVLYAEGDLSFLMVGKDTNRQRKG